MSSGSKFARGTGHGQIGPPHNRGPVLFRQGPASGKKTSVGPGRDITGSLDASNVGTATNGRDESFQLLAEPSTTGCPFAMFIRLQPEILDELKQAKADGIQASMKFGTNASGHVIQVGSESFKFSSAPEPGDLCDIYEQKQGEIGEAVLVEAGSAWRKLSVLRILSATEKDRVKKRTTEAEHRQKQRKSILVDPSTRMIIPQAGAADGHANGRKTIPNLSKEPPPKKRRVTAASPIKQKSQTTISAITGNRQFGSPASPSLEPLATIVRGTQMNDSNPPKGRAGSERVTSPSSSLAKEKPIVSAASAMLENTKCGSATNLTDLRNFLIGFMQENPKGVTNKIIEKAVAESLSGIADKRALDKVMKSIASFHAPGKYLLNSGVEKGNYLEPGPPASSGKAQEAVRPSTHEAELLNDSVDQEVMKEKDAHSSLDKAIVKQGSPKLIEAQPPQSLESNIISDLSSKQKAVHASKDLCIGASDSSSSSGSGSGSDSESNSSGSGTESGSGSGSGSDSDSSSSSSGASMDEDVDIMSDDDGEKGKLDAKQKLKVKEPKPLTKEDSKLHEVNECEHVCRESNPSTPLLDSANAVRSDTLAKVSDSIIEAVFGPDETEDFGEFIRDQTEVKSAQSNYGERKAPAKAQTSKGSKNGNFGECYQSIPTRHNEALEVTEDLENMVETLYTTKKEFTGGAGSKQSLLACQQENSKALLKSQGPSKDNEKRRADTEHINGSNVGRRDHSNYTFIEGRSILRNRLSLEAHNLPLIGSPTDTEEGTAKTSSEKSCQTGAEARKAVSKKLNTKETHEKFEMPKPSEVLPKRIPSNVVRSNQGSANTFEDTLKLDDERIDRLCDRGGAETSDFCEAKPKKDKAMNKRTSDGAKIDDISGRQSKGLEAQHVQQRDVATPSKGNEQRVSREWNYLSASHDRTSPHTHKPSKVVKHSRQKAESLERTGLMVDQAERPLEDSDSTRRGKDMHGKVAFIKETELVGKFQGGEPSSVVARGGARVRQSGQSHGQSNILENYKALSQLPESRGPLHENGALEPNKCLSSTEDPRVGPPSGTTGRLLHKGSSSPDQDDYQPLDRRLLEMSRQSPVRVFEDKHRAYDARNTKRKPEQVESRELERSKRRGGGGEAKQLQRKEEWFQEESGKQNHTDKGRISASDSQEYAGTSKFTAFENSVRSVEDDELNRYQRPTRAASSDLRKDNVKAGDSLDNSKRQSPQSRDKVEECGFFAPYEKTKPALRGLIDTFQEYKEYYKEYHEKYAIYVKLNGVIERHKKPFESLRKDLDRARSKEDEKKLAHTCAKVRREYAQHRKSCKRMFHTFQILHEELKAIKNRCKEYAEKVGQG